MKGFFRNVFSVFIGTVFVQLIPIIASLFITRIFAPEAFGEFSTWLAIVTLISVVITLRFETALAITGDGIVRKKAVLFITLISLIVSLTLFLLLLIIYLSHDKDIFLSSKTLMMLCIPASLTIAYNQVWQTWAAVEGLYKKMIVMRVFQATTLAFLQVLLGVLNASANSLALSFLIAGAISFVLSKLLMPNIFSYEFFKLNELKSFFIQYKKFPIFSLPADSISTATAQLPLLFIAYRFGLDIAGFFSLTMRVLGAPIGLVGKAVLDVFKRYAAQEFLKTGHCKKLYETTFFILVLASIVLVSGTVFLGETIFSVAFGENWKHSGTIAIWLLPLFAMKLIASPLSYMVYIVEKQQIDLFWQIVLALVTLFSLFVFDDYQKTIILYSFMCAGMYCIYIWLSYSFSKGNA